MKDKIGALIIKDKRLLIVSGHDAAFYWSPGGKIEDGETHESCLARELQEELGITLVSAAFFATKTYFREEKGAHWTAHYYFVEYDGELAPGAEVQRLFWYGKEDYERDDPKITDALRLQVIPELIEKGLL